MLESDVTASPSAMQLTLRDSKPYGRQVGRVVFEPFAAQDLDTKVLTELHSSGILRKTRGVGLAEHYALARCAVLAWQAWR